MWTILIVCAVVAITAAAYVVWRFYNLISDEDDEDEEKSE